MLTILKTFEIILALENTINVNVILNGIRHIPLIGKYIPEKIYSIKIFKIYAAFLSVQYEIVRAFFGKLGLFAAVLFLSAVSTNFKENSSACAYIYLFLAASLITLTAFNAFRLSTAAEYAVFHLGMDAKNYVQANIFYDVIKTFAGYTVFGIPTAILAGVQWFVAILIPFAGAGFITMSLGIQMTLFAWKKSLSKKSAGKLTRGRVEGGLVLKFIFLFILFTAAFAVTPFFIYKDLYLPGVIIVLIAGLSFVPGFLLIRRFPYMYYRNIISREREKDEIVKEINKSANHPQSKVSVNKSAGIKDDIKGYKYLNELFLKRHTKTMFMRFVWVILMTLSVIALASLYMRVELMHTSDPDKMLMRFFFISHPAFYPLILLFTNLGIYMSEVMYKSCDSTFLTFAFYRKPETFREMYRLRVMSVIKYNLPLTTAVAIFCVAVVFLTGGEDYFFETVLNIIIIYSAMVFYSVRCMILHYLLQPFTQKVKNLNAILYYSFSMFSFVFWLVLLIAKVPAFAVAPLCILLAVAGFYLGDRLVYKYAPRVFKAQ